MSATLTWHQGGGLANSGSASDTQFFTDLKAMFDDKAADSDFKWEVASSNLGSTPRQITLKRKDASDGRILIVMWDSSAPNNPSFANSTPNTGIPYIGYFPNGNVDTPSNLTSTSTPVMGDDTDSVMLANGYYRSSWYNGTTDRFYYMESDAGMVIWVQNPASSGGYWFAAGDLLVDENDDAFPTTMGSSSNSLSQWGTTSAAVGWNSTITGPNTTDQQSYAHINSHCGGTPNTKFFCPVTYNFAATAPSTNMLRDNTNDKLYFLPIYVKPYGRGSGIVGKFRQLAVGPDASAPFESPNMTGPVVAAIVMDAYNGGAMNGRPWATNFKV